MIQRIQSVWLLLAAVFAFWSLNTTFKFGSPLGQNPTSFNGLSNIWIAILTVILGLLSLVAIFLFKNRTRQIATCVVALLLSLGIIVLYFVETKDWLGNVALSSVVLFVEPVFLLLAIRGISNDKKLLKSVDRLRD